MPLDGFGLLSQPVDDDEVDDEIRRIMDEADQNDDDVYQYEEVVEIVKKLLKAKRSAKHNKRLAYAGGACGFV